MLFLNNVTRTLSVILAEKDCKTNKEHILYQIACVTHTITYTCMQELETGSHDKPKSATESWPTPPA